MHISMCGYSNKLINFIRLHCKALSRINVCLSFGCNVVKTKSRLQMKMKRKSDNNFDYIKVKFMKRHFQSQTH